MRYHCSLRNEVVDTTDCWKCEVRKQSHVSDWKRSAYWCRINNMPDLRVHLLYTHPDLFFVCPLRPRRLKAYKRVKEEDE